MVDVHAALERAFDTCENEHEVLIMIAGVLLATLWRINGSAAPEESDPNKWPALLVAEMKRVYAIPNRPPALTEWFQGAGQTLVELRRVYNLTAPS